MSFRSCCLFVTLTLGVTFAQSPALRLSVTSASVNLETHTANIELFNSGDKQIVAYTLNITQTSSEKAQTLTVSFDNLYFRAGINSEDSREHYFIQPGQRYEYSMNTNPDVTAVSATVKTVVYADRTYEGDKTTVATIFAVRAKAAEDLKQAVTFLANVPATQQARHDAIQKIRDLQTNIADDVLHDQLNVPVALIADNKQVLPLDGNISDDSIKQAVAQLNERRSFWLAQSEMTK